MYAKAFATVPVKNPAIARQATSSGKDVAKPEPMNVTAAPNPAKRNVTLRPKVSDNLGIYMVDINEHPEYTENIIPILLFDAPRY
jgi:hypothetical protein